jgi:hypothetical protein
MKTPGYKDRLVDGVQMRQTPHMKSIHNRVVRIAPNILTKLAEGRFSVPTEPHRSAKTATEARESAHNRGHP